MSTLADYVGRKVDVLALRGQVAEGVATLSQSLFDEFKAGEICTGIQKLAQRWILEFLTELGSMPFLPDRGCTFMTAVRNSQLQTETDVITAFNFAAIDIRRNLLAEETDSMPDDERLASAVLIQLALTPGYISLTVQITSLAGNSRKAILPISVLP